MLAARGVDQADWHLEALQEMTPKEVTSRGKLAHRRGSADLPFSYAFALRSGLGRFPDGEHAQIGIIGRGDFLRGISYVVHAHAHVRLAGASPDLAHRDVLHGQRILAGDDKISGLAWCQAWEFDFPLAGIVGCRIRGGFISELHRDLLTWIGPAPDGDRHVALQHGVVGEHGGELYVGVRGKRVARKCAE